MADSAGGCDHFQPSDVMRMAEEYLNGSGVNESDWDGKRFGYGEDVHSPYWKSVYVEVVRRSGNWVVVKLDRSSEPIPTEKRGFQAR